MTWIGIADVSLGAAIPLAVVVQGQLDTSLLTVVPEITAKLEGALEAQAELTITPPTIAGDLEAAIGLVSQLELVVGMPSVSLDLTMVAGIVAEIQATLGNLSGMLGFGALLTTPGIYIARHEGAIGDVLPAGLPGGTGAGQPAQGIGLFAATPSAWVALQAVFRTT